MQGISEETEQHYRDLIDHINDLVMTHDLKGTLLSVNPAVTKLSGYSEAEMIGRNLRDFIDPEYRQDFDDVYLKQIIEEESSSGIMFTWDREGNRHYLEYRNILLRPEHGEPYISGIGRDITRRVKAERALKQSKKYAEHVLKIVPSAVFTVDLDRRITSWNEYAFQITGYSAEEVLGKTCLFFALSPCTEKCNLFDAGIPKPINGAECSIWTKDGRILNLRKNVDVIEDDQGKVIGGIESFEDITEKKILEENLQRERDNLQSVLQASPIGLIVFDKNKRVTISNSAAEQLFHRTKTELGGVRCGDFIECVHRHDDPKGCGKTEHCPDCLLNESLDKILSSSAGGHEENGEALVKIESSPVPLWLSFKVRPLTLNGAPCAIMALNDVTETKKAEDALKKSETRLKNTQAIARLGSWEFDLQTNRLYWSEEVFRIFGLMPREFKPDYQAFLDAVHPEDRGRVDKTYQQALLRGLDVYEVEHRIIRKDTGEIRFVYEKCENEKDITGRIVRSIGMVQDITERKKNEETITKQATMMNSLLGAIRESALLVDPRGVVLLANPTYAERMGKPLKKIIGRPFTDFLPEELGQKRMERLQEVLTTGRPLYFEDIRFGRHIDVHYYPVVDPRTETVSAVTILGFDVTERKQAEQELRKLRRSVENSPLSIVITDLEGTIEYVNPAFCSITGYCRDEALGQNPNVLKSGMHDEAFYKDLWQTITSGQTWRSEMANRKKSGEIYWEQVAISPVRDSDGNVSHFVAIKEDITEKKDLERLKEEVDRIMRHDLKSPLNGIIGLPQILAVEGNLNDEQRDILKAIEDSGRNMLNMIDLSLDMFKIETGTYEYWPIGINAASTIDQLIGHNRSTLSKKNLSCRVLVNGKEFSGKDPFMIPADKRLFHAMLSNLFTNAIEASPPGGEITFELTGGDPASITIQNRGVVPEEIRDYFFLKYKTYGKTKGTGLGTYSAKLLADAMNYRLEMETSDEEKKTRLNIHIPTASPAPTGNE